MRRMPRFAGWLLGLALCCPASRAGLYLPIEKDYQRLPVKVKQFRLLLDDRQGILLALDPKRDPKDVPLYAKQVVQTVASLEKKRKESQLTIDEGVSLGGYYLLMQKADAALRVLEEMQKREPKNFMVLANLAMAYQALEVFERAEGNQIDLMSRSIWPKTYPGWTPERLRWQLRAEQFYRTFQGLRRQEVERLPPGARRKTDLKLDNLFPGARFVGPDGQYMPGQTDSATQDALPPDAAALVEQLLLWMPNDNNLQWLLAEVYNAQGEIQPAESLMAKLLNNGLSGEGLREHHRILKEAVTPKPAPPPEEPPWRPDLRSVGVGGGIGFVVGMLLVLQLRQLFRKRTPRTT